MSVRTKRFWTRIGPKSRYFLRCDYNYEEVYLSNDNFRLCKMPTSEGKWLLFSPVDNLMDRIADKNFPEVWANNIIDREMK